MSTSGPSPPAPFGGFFPQLPYKPQGLGPHLATFMTRTVQRQRLAPGVPVVTFHSSLGGVTLCEGPKWVGFL